MWRPYLGGKSVEFVTFSPDHHSVAYVAFPEEVLYRANLSGTAPQQLTEPPLAVKSAAWSPDGSQILVTGQIGNGDFEMYLVPAQGGTPRRVIPGDNENEGDPQWSADGSKVAYWTIGPSGDALGAVQPTQLKIFDLTSKTAISLPGSGNEFSTRWSPDGRYIAILTIDEHKLKVFDLLSRRWTTLREGITNYPAWSSDSKSIYFLDQGTAMGRVPVAGGKEEIVASLEDMPGTGSLGAWLGLDPNDSPLFLRDKGTNEIYAMPLDLK